jgi:hypothetical protein
MGRSAARVDAMLRPEHLAGYVTGVVATLVAIGGLYLANKLEATTAIAIVAAGPVAIWPRSGIGDAGDAPGSRSHGFLHT